MPSFSAPLVPGTKPPYDTWTFVIVPDRVLAALGAKPARVRGTIQGVAFTGTVSKGEGVYRVPVSRALQAKAGVARGDEVRVVLEVDPEPGRVEVPEELREALDADPDLARRFEELPPSHRRAWAGYVGEAKRVETRARRAAQAREGIRGKKYPGG